MSRKIKYRVWDEGKKKYCTEYDAMTLKHDGEFCIERGWCIISGGFEVEQYTGLKDKNGKEIYEGDIVNVIGIGIAQVIDSPSGEWMLYYMREPDEINNGFVSVIPKNKPSGLWKANFTSYIEVIGNIHENPELLGGEG